MAKRDASEQAIGQPGIFPRVPGDLPQDYPDASPPGNAWTIYNYREQRCYWHFGRPAEWTEDVQRDYDPEALTVAERRRKEAQAVAART
jgi:hypothetical protein